MVDEEVGVLDSEKVGDGWLPVAERERLRSMLRDGESVPVSEYVLVGTPVTLPVWERLWLAVGGVTLGVTEGRVHVVVSVHVRTLVDVKVMLPLRVGVRLRDGRWDGLSVPEMDAAVEDTESICETLEERVPLTLVVRVGGESVGDAEKEVSVPVGEGEKVGEGGEGDGVRVLDTVYDPVTVRVQVAVLVVVWLDEGGLGVDDRLQVFGIEREGELVRVGDSSERVGLGLWD
mmetsp:Transcript_51906/g.92605  ORF Transcript_51906/g.92605 Transcript_51906/m.92605 type:complete len:232 (+) Transcript_51906:1040-1735(+)